MSFWCDDASLAKCPLSLLDAPCQSLFTRRCEKQQYSFNSYWLKNGNFLARLCLNSNEFFFGETYDKDVVRLAAPKNLLRNTVFQIDVIHMVIGEIHLSTTVISTTGLFGWLMDSMEFGTCRLLVCSPV